MNTIKCLCCFCFFLMGAQMGWSQQSAMPEKSFWQKLRFGGNVGANFGNGFTSILLAPQAMYPVNDFFGVGAGLNYAYSERDLNNRNFQDFTSVVMGGSILALGNPLPNVQMSADFEYLNVNQNFDNKALDRQYWVPALFVGAGYQQGGVVIGARYDVLFNDNRSIYANAIQPFVRVFF